MGHAAGSSSEILSVQKCELLHLDDQGALKVVAIGRVHPTDDRFVHGCPIIDGFVKVQIDRVVEGCGSTHLLPESCIYGEIELLKDAKGSFIQWPVKLIKFETTPTNQQQVIPNERNEYQIYRMHYNMMYALQHDETFNQLFSENTTAEHVSFRKPTKPVHAYQHTKPFIANQPTKTVHANQSTEPIRDCQHTKPIVASKPST
ncbi:hypothetical protein Hdeb2414_s0025g00658121 [Helianthus debilis subsp. tardiflorus]